MINFFSVKTSSVYGFRLFNFIDVSGKNALEPEYSCVDHLMGCYKYYSKENWEDAKAQCKRDGTHLNLIRSQDDNARLQSFI